MPGGGALLIVQLRVAGVESGVLPANAHREAVGRCRASLRGGLNDPLVVRRRRRSALSRTEFRLVRRFAVRRFLELNEDDMRVGVTNILAGMLLRRKPARRSCPNLDFELTIACTETTTERAQRIHDAVGMTMRSGPITRTVEIVQDTHPVVLCHDVIEVRIADDWILRHARRVSPIHAARRALPAVAPAGDRAGAVLRQAGGGAVPWRR